MKKSILFTFVSLGLLLLSCDPDEVEVAVTSVSLNQATTEMLVGETVRLSATVTPANATDRTVTWASSKQSVATVSNDGVVTAVAEGSSTITASAGGKSATCTVVVSKKTIPVTSVTLDKSSLTLEEGQTTTLVATVSPAEATDTDVTWKSSNPEVAPVDENGTVQALSEGQAVITASAGGKSATCTVTVSKKTVPVTSVTLDRSSLTLEKGQAATLVATVSPEDATDKDVKWKSTNPEVAPVDENGTVQALSEGQVVITASAGGKSATCTVTVTKKTVPVTSVTLDKSSLTLEEGQTTTLVATVNPADATDKDVKWKSTNPEVASVDENGTVQALSEGQAVITASAGGKSATCTVTVSKKTIPVTSVTLDRSSLTLEEGQAATLVATVSPTDATDKDVKWKSTNPNVAPVDENGTVQALSEGQVVITASAGGKSATCTVTVSKKTVPVTSVTLDRSSLTLEKDQTTTLVATVSPADATDKDVKWKSSHPEVAPVNENGTVQALSEGQAVITASAGGKSATCVITVVKKYIPVISISLDRNAVTLEIGQTTTLVATVSPTDATDKTVSWINTDDTVISLNNGKVTALKEGTSTVTAIAGDKSSSCVVTVAKSVVPVTSVTLDQTSVVLEKGKSVKLVATVKPTDATDKTVSWASSDVSIASVDQDGTVRGSKGGSATITAKAGEQSATCRVTVITPITAVSLDRSSLSLEVGQTSTLVATISPEDATEKAVTWSSSDSSIASVDESGKVTALKKGSATITAKAGDKSATCTVTVSNITFAISPTQVTLPGAGGRFEIKVTCSGTYHISSIPDWVTEKSINGTTHTFEVASNPKSEDRNGVVVFCDDEGTCLPCQVVQAAGGSFAVSPSSVEINAAGGTFKVKVACATGYHISSKPDWISDITEPSMIQEHAFKVTPNKSEEERNGVIVFCDDQGTCLPCAVKQKGHEPDSVGGGNEDVPDGDPVKW